MMKTALNYHIVYGHKGVQAKAVARGANKIEDAEVTLHNSEEAENWEFLADVDAIIFGSPTYMNSPSAQFEAFMDAS